MTVGVHNISSRSSEQRQCSFEHQIGYLRTTFCDVRISDTFVQLNRIAQTEKNELFENIESVCWAGIAITNHSVFLAVLVQRCNVKMWWVIFVNFYIITQYSLMRCVTWLVVIVVIVSNVITNPRASVALHASMKVVKEQLSFYINNKHRTFT